MQSCTEKYTLLHLLLSFNFVFIKISPRLGGVFVYFDLYFGFYVDILAELVYNLIVFKGGLKNMLTLSKKDIKVVPTELHEMINGRHVKYFMFVEKGDKKDYDKDIYCKKFVSVDEPTCGFFKCTYISKDGIRRTAYVTYDGQLTTDEKQIASINEYMSKCEDAKKEIASFDECSATIEKMLRDLGKKLNVIGSAQINEERKKYDL